MLNFAIMTGRLVADPELRHTNNETPVASLRIAVGRDFAKKGEDSATDFFDVVAWRKTAEFVCSYFKKGSLITVVGRMENREWTDKAGQNRISTELVADRAYFGESKRKDSSEHADPFDYGIIPANVDGFGAFDPNADTDDDLPF